MVAQTLEQRWEILRDYFENHCNIAEYVGKLPTDLGRRHAPSAPCVRYIVQKRKETGIVINKPGNIVREAPLRSIHHRSQQLNISETSLRRILHKDHGMTPCKV